MRCELLPPVCGYASTSQVAQIYLLIEHAYINGLVPFCGLCLLVSFHLLFDPTALIVKFQHIFQCQLSFSQKMSLSSSLMMR